MTEEAKADEAGAEEKKPRKIAYVLVSIPNWPPQDPGRKMIYSIRPSEKKAIRMAKRLNRQIPEYKWEPAVMTAREATQMKHAPIVVEVGDSRVRVRWTGRVWRMENIDAS